MSENLWVITELYWPEQTSTAHYLTGIAEGLALTTRTSVICGQPGYEDKAARAPKREKRREVSISRCGGTKLSKDRLVFRLVNAVTITLSIFLHAIRNFRRGDRVLVVTNPPFLPFAIAIAARLRGCPLILLVHDVYPELLHSAGVLSEQSIPYQILHRLSRTIYRRASRVVVLGRDMYELVAARVAKPGKLVIIPNWSDLDEIAPLERSQTRLTRKLDLANRFVVQYSGNMGRTHGIEDLWTVTQRLGHRKELHFLLIGAGAKKKWLDEQVALTRARNVTVLGRSAREDLADALGSCDVSIVSLVPGMAGVSVPSRLYNVLASGRPIIAIAEAHSELARVVIEEEIGWVVEPGNLAQLEETILDAATSRDRLSAMGLRARKAAEDKYSYAAVIALYRDVVAAAD